MRDGAKHFELGKIGLDRRGFGALDVIEAHDFVLDVEVQLPSEKCPQVFVDEVIHRVPSGVLVYVLCQQGPFLVLLRGRGNGHKPLVFLGTGKAVEGGKHDLDGLRVSFVAPGVLLS